MMTDKPDWLARVLAELGRFPAPLRTLGYALFRHNPDGKPFEWGNAWEEQEKAREKAIAEFTTLSRAEMESLWNLFAPQLMPLIADVWAEGPTSFADMPPFRNPFRQRWNFRTYWLTQVLEMICPNQRTLVESLPVIHQMEWLAQAYAILFSSAIDRGVAGADEIWEHTLRAARGESADAPFSSCAIYTLCMTNRPEGWEQCGRLLLAAQRQEGLRNLILGAATMGRIEPFLHIIRLIDEEKLTRFVGVAQYVNSWFGLQYGREEARKLGEVIAQYRYAYESAENRTTIWQSTDGQAIYLALMALGAHDIQQTWPVAEQLLDRPEAVVRYAAASYLLLTHDQREGDVALWQKLLLDHDLRIASLAVRRLQWDRGAENVRALHELLERQFGRFPAKSPALQPLIWAWEQPIATSADVATAWWATRGDRPFREFYPYFGQLNSGQWRELAEMIDKQGAFSAEDQAILLQIAGDTQGYTREMAFIPLRKIGIDGTSAPILEGYLHRKDAQLRRSLLELLLTQTDALALQSAERLLKGKTDRERQAGLELLVEMKKTGRSVASVTQLADRFAAQAKKRSSAETVLLQTLHPAQTPETLDPLTAFGLFDPTDRTPFVQPPLTPPNIPNTSQLLLQSLAQYIDDHAEMGVTYTGWQGDEQTQCLVDLVLWHLGHVNLGLPLAERQQQFILYDFLAKWWEAQPAEWHEAGNFGLWRLRAYCFFYGIADEDLKMQKAKPQAEVFGQHQPVVGSEKAKSLASQLVNDYLWKLFPYEEIIGRMLDLAQAELQLAPRAPYHQNVSVYIWAMMVEELRQDKAQVATWPDAEHIRLWRFTHWYDQPEPTYHRLRPNGEILLEALGRGAANEADLLDACVGACGCDLCTGKIKVEGVDAYSYYWTSTHLLSMLSGRIPTQQLPHSDHPVVLKGIARLRERIIPIELQRGELITPASPCVHALQYSGGMAVLLEGVWNMGKELFARGWQSDAQSRSSLFSHIIRTTYPSADDTPQRFAEQAKVRPISAERWVEVAMYAPQWVTHIEAALGWDGLAEGVWWMHAHTKDKQWQISQEIREMWRAEISKHTPLSAEELLDGAVDVAWFHRCHQQLGTEKWRYLDNAAKYTSSGTGHARAQLFSTALLHQTNEAQLQERIRHSRHQDAVRALGLLPLPSDEQARQEGILGRYLALQNYLQESKKFGAQKRASEKIAAEIGMDNLARTAGYPDPLRLQWAMEYHAVADLAEGFVERSADGVTVRLSIDGLGEPQISVSKGEKPLKAVPPTLKKQPQIAELFERQRELRQQLRRMRGSLEQAMVRGDRFMVKELGQLLRHPILRPLLQAVLFINEGGQIGYVANSADHLIDHAQQTIPLAANDTVRLVHAYDFYQQGAWAEWQRHCFQTGRVQPFRQLFRELYLLTPAERETGTYSLRYHGQQVNGTQAMALLGQTGWIADYNGGGIQRTFHKEGLTAWLDCSDGLYIGSALLTLDRVAFTKRNQWERLPLEQIPPLLFSEVMRSLDLVVSVAHAGGVDPEASLSTIEMRAMLVRESAELLKLHNVTVEERRVLIDGTIGKYGVHLNSGVVHQRPGGYVCIVPVHAQHRGRLFLPFVDDDPKSAEILSKVILLANDQQIKDPTILQQLRTR